MTKKDYDLISQTINKRIKELEAPSPYKTPGCYDREIIATAETADDLAYAFAEQDKRFKRNKFLADCGVTLD